MYSEAIRTAIRFTKVKPSYSSNSEWDLHVLNNRLIPFQIKRTARANVLTEFAMVFIDESNTEQLLPILDVATLPTIVSFVGYDIIQYKADQNTSDFTSGRHYLKVSDGVDTWYSMNIINVPCVSLVNPIPVPIDDGSGSQIDDIIIDN